MIKLFFQIVFIISIDVPVACQIADIDARYLMNVENQIKKLKSKCTKFQKRQYEFFHLIHAEAKTKDTSLIIKPIYDEFRSLFKRHQKHLRTSTLIIEENKITASYQQYHIFCYGEFYQPLLDFIFENNLERVFMLYNMTLGSYLGIDNHKKIIYFFDDGENMKILTKNDFVEDIIKFP